MIHSDADTNKLSGKGSVTMKVIQVAKEIGNKTILNNINLEVNPGEIVGLIGPNGAGKTTTMKIMSGLTVNYSGEISGNERVGMLIDGPKFFPNKTARENLAYFQSMTKDSYSTEYIESLFDMKEYQNKKVKNFSLGMKQRLGMGIALINKNELLILDEPMNGLDPDGIQATIETLKYLAKELNLAIIISSHILGDLEKLCDRAYFIKNGEIVYQTQIGTEERYQFTFSKEDVSMAEKVMSQIGNFETINDSFIVDASVRVELMKLLFRFDLFPIEIKRYEANLEELYFSLKEETN